MIDGALVRDELRWYQAGRYYRKISDQLLGNQDLLAAFSYFSITDKGLVKYYKTKKAFYGGKPTTTSFTKWLMYMNKRLPDAERMTEAEIQTLQAHLSNSVSLDNYEHRIVHGYELVDRYGIAHSCMSGSSALGLYEENPDKVKMVVVSRKDDGKDFARALLWTTDAGDKFLDRIYPSNGGRHIRYLEKLAKGEGWYYKTEQSTGGAYIGPDRMTVTLKDVGCYPYMDTFYKATRAGNKLIVSTRSFVPNPGDTPWADMNSTEDSDPWEEDIAGTDRHGDVVYESEVGDYVYCEYNDYYVYHAEAVEVVNSYGYYDGERLPSSVVETRDGEYVDLDRAHDYVYVEWGAAQGEWVHAGDCQYHESTDAYVLIDDWDDYLEEIEEEDDSN